MKAAVLERHGDSGNIVIKSDFPNPACDPEHVVIRVAATALNYHDLFTRNGMPGIKIPLPLIMGIDIAGTIQAVGEGVSEWKVGDRVLVDPADRRVGGGLIGETSHGGLAEMCKVPARQLIRIPDGVDFPDAAALPVAYGTARRMMLTRGKIQKGEKVLILGASGGVGTCCVMLAKLAGAEVIACAGSSEKLDRLKKMGADHVIDYRSPDWFKQIYTLFGKPNRRSHEGGVDVVVNFTGGETWVPSLRVLRKGGRLLTCGATAGFDPKTDIRFIWTFELEILGSNGWTKEDLVALLDLVKEGKLRPVIHEVLPLERVRDAFALLENRDIFGKVIIKP